MINALSGKTVLVTGASGFIGSHLLRRLKVIPEIKIIALTRKEIKQQEDASLYWLSSSLQELTPLFWKKNNIDHIDMIFHLGAFTPKSSHDANNISAIYSDNLQGMRCLIDGLPNVPERILFASTLDVYASPKNGTVLAEQSPLGPISLYGASKLFGEQLIKVYAEELKCSYSILRYGHIYGPGEIAYRKLIPETIRKLLTGQAPVIYGDGSSLRDFLFVDDAVEATLRAATHSLKQLGPINIVRGESAPLREIVGHLISYSKQAIEPQYLLEKPNGESLRFDNQYMRKMLGEWDMVPLLKGLELENDYFKQQAV